MSALRVRLTDGMTVPIRTGKWTIVTKTVDHDGEKLYLAPNAWEIVVRRQGSSAQYLVSGRKTTARPWLDVYSGYVVASIAEVPSAVEKVAQEIGREELATQVLANLPPEEL